MTSLFIDIYDRLHSRPGLCRIAMAVITVVLVALAASLRYNENIYDFLPLAPTEQRAMDIYQDISHGQRVVLMVSADGETDEALIEEAVDTLERCIADGYGSIHVRNLVCRVDYDRMSSLVDYVYDHVPIMLCDSDYAAMEALLSHPGLTDERLSTDAAILLTPAGGAMADGITRDPLMLFAPVMQRLRSRLAAMPYELDDGYILTPDHRYALVTLDSPYGTIESGGNAQLTAYLDSAAAHTMQSVPGVRVSATGAPVIAVGNATQIRRDSMLTVTISVLLILALLVYVFRSMRHIMCIGVSIVFGWLFAMAGMTLVTDRMSLIVLGLGSVIIGIAVNYPLHYIAHGQHGGSPREILRDIVAPLFIGNVTTVGAFACLIPLDAPALHDLGLFAAFMLIGTILFVVVFLPHIVRTTHSHAPSITRHRQRLPRLSAWLGARYSAITARPMWTMAAVSAITLVLGYYSLGTKFDASIMSVNYMSHEQTRLLGDLGMGLGPTDTTTVYAVAEGTTWDEALDRLTAADSVIRRLRQDGEVEGVTGICSFVTSQREQARRIAMWDTFWARHRDAVLRRIDSVAPRYGFQPDAFAPFRDLTSRTYRPQTVEDFAPLTETVFEDALCTRGGMCAVVECLHTTPARREHVKQCLDGTQGIYAFHFEGLGCAISDALSDNFNYICFACGIIVFAFLWLSFGSLELSLLAFLPMAVGWIWILGIMRLLGMQFNIVNVILATFIFGQGDDYTIFMVEGLVGEYATRRPLLSAYKRSILISALIMFTGMGTLILALHPALYSLAEVTIVGMGTVVLMAWMLPPLIFRYMTMRDGRYRVRPLSLASLTRRLLNRDCPCDGSDEHYRRDIIDRFRYKGAETARAIRRELREGVIERARRYDVTADAHVQDCGAGTLPILLALMHPQSVIHAYMPLDDRRAIAQHSASDLANLVWESPQDQKNEV